MNVFVFSEARPFGAARSVSFDLMYFVYILKSEKDQKTYVGFTENLENRIKKHNEGYVKSTKHRTPLKLLFSESFSTASEAKRREKWWKGSSGRRKLKEIFNNL